MQRSIIVIGASAGGVSALKELVAGLPPDLNAAVFIVLHLGASARSALHDILQRETSLTVRQALDGEPIVMGEIRVARPDYHLILEQDRIRLTRGPRENRFRPAIDSLFRSAAYAHGAAVIGVMLTGALDDGVSGLWWIKNRGGAVVVQSPSNADFPFMPENALSAVQADYVLPTAQMPAAFASLMRSAAPPLLEPSQQLEVEVQIAKERNALEAGIMNLGQLTPYTCPECHGALVQLKEGLQPHFRCHTGHAYSINTLLAEVTEYVEDSLWNSIRAIEESAMVLRHLAQHAREAPANETFARLCEEKASDTLRRSEALRRVAHEQQTLSSDNMKDAERGAH
jgi:two-component system chemotaxis response regulator CheB